MKSYLSEPECAKGYIQGNTRCKLAITSLPEQVYANEWDVIMIDAPRGYYKEAPGRMGAIYSAAVMARNRKKTGVTHVFLHDVDRKVEKTYAEEFLCRKNLKKAVRRLWHFEIPPAENVTTENASSRTRKSAQVLHDPIIDTVPNSDSKSGSIFGSNQ
ncbi:probable methyltransferase [Tanacetum coccineum]